MKEKIIAFKRWFTNKMVQKTETDCLDILGEESKRNFFGEFYKRNELDLLYIAEILKILKKERENTLDSLTADEFLDFLRQCNVELEQDKLKGIEIKQEEF